MTQIKARPPKTVEDFMRLPEGTLAELVGGELLMTPSPKSLHQAAVLNLGSRLLAHVSSAGLGRIYVAPMDVHLPSGDIVEPDVLYIAKANEGIIQDWIRGVPDLLVEVVSPDGVERDRLLKKELYARNGVGEYWLVDPEARSVEVLRLSSGGRYEPAGYYEEADTLTSPCLPGFTVSVRLLFS